MLVALEVLRLLVQVKSTNDAMGAALAVEESLRDRITFLETQLNGTKATFRYVGSFDQFISLRKPRD